jgi:selenocysteine lyase/cysteine desulfurase
MGYEDLIIHRAQVPVTEQLIYLNHAAIGPLSRPAAEAIQWLAEDALRYGSTHYDPWLATYSALRRGAARLVNGSPQEIALVKNTSEGIATIAMGLDWRPGDRIIAFREEFPANQYPWQRLESKGVKVDWLAAADPLDRIDEAAKGARLLAISFVQYLTGHRANLEAIGEICRRRGVIYFVDAIRCDSGAGSFPARRAGRPYRRARRGWSQMAAGAGRLRDFIHLSSAAGARGAGGVRLD